MIARIDGSLAVTARHHRVVVHHPLSIWILLMSIRQNPHTRRLAPTVLAPMVLAKMVLASALVAGTLSACGSPSGANDDTVPVPSPSQGIVAGTLEARVDRAAQTISLRNATGSDVGYMIIEKDMMTVALMPPCGTSCPTIQPGGSASVKYSSISGYTPQAKEARVLWWTYTRHADGTRTTQGGVNTVSISL